MTLITHGPTVASYRKWISVNDTFRPSDIAAITQHLKRMSVAPLISIIMPVYNTDNRLLRQTIASVQAQFFTNWELCIVDDASPNADVWPTLQGAAAGDARIKITRRSANGHISAASNSALAMATGVFVALLDHDDLLPRQALYEISAEIEKYPDVDILYSDEDKIDGKGKRFDPYFKTGWNAELLLAHNFVSHLGVYRRALLEKIGGFRVGFEGSQDYDLVLRASERTSEARIRHIPAVLYHWRQGAGSSTFSERALAQCASAAQRAVAEHLERTGCHGAQIAQLPSTNAWVQVRRPLPATAPLVSLIMAVEGPAETIARSLQGLLHRTVYARFEILICVGGELAEDTLALLSLLETDRRIRILPAAETGRPISRNSAATAANGDILLFLETGIEAVDPSWLSEMVAQAVRPEIGGVGAKLLGADGKLRHGGTIVGPATRPGLFAELHEGASGMELGYFGHLQTARDVAAVSGACLAIRREVFTAIEGFDEASMSTSFSDVDLCLKMRSRGYRIVWTPLAELYLLRPSTPVPTPNSPAGLQRSRDIAAMRLRWGRQLESDQFYGPHFDQQTSNFELSDRSSRQRPWVRPPRTPRPGAGEGLAELVAPPIT